MTPDINSYKLTLRKIESLPEASFHDALLAVILVTTMLFRVFFRSLDREKTWYALNDRLCGKQPRKFSEGSFFRLFPDLFLRVNFADLHDVNGEFDRSTSQVRARVKFESIFFSHFFFQ